MSVSLPATRLTGTPKSRLPRVAIVMCFFIMLFAGHALQAKAQAEVKYSASAYDQWSQPAKIKLPDNLAVGDLMIVTLVIPDPRIPSAQTIQTPDANWVVGQEDFNNWLRYNLYYKFADASDISTDSIKFNFQNNTAWSIGLTVVTNANNEQPLLYGGIAKGDYTTTYPFDISAPSITTTNPNTLVLSFWGAKVNTSFSLSWSNLNYGNTLYYVNSNMDNTGQYVSYSIQSSAGPTDVNSVQMSNPHYWIAQQIIVQDAGTVAEPISLTYPKTDFTFYTNTEIATLTPTLEGVADTYEISPELPDGLIFDTSNGEISGTPIVASPLTAYTVSAYNSQGSDAVTATLNIQVLLGAIYTADYTSPDTYYTFTVPDGISQITVEAWGGGGGANSTGNASSRPGGGGGAYASSTINVVPGTQYTVKIGKGGVGSSEGQGGDSGIKLQSSPDYIQNYIVLAKGGSVGGLYGGEGGSKSESIGQVTYKGGNGASGGGYNGGGGGGGSAWPYSDGGNGTSPDYVGGGAGGEGYGNGGHGGAPNHNGLNGQIPGGGAGGLGTNGSYDEPTGVGAPGMVIITWEIPDAPTSIEYEAPEPFTYNTLITDLVPTVVGFPATYTISPDLPKGLNIDISTGVISGTPKETISTTEFTVTAKNAGGEVSDVVSITVNKLDVTVELIKTSKGYGQSEPKIEIAEFPSMPSNHQFFPGTFERETGEDVGEYEIGIGTNVVMVYENNAWTNVTNHFNFIFEPAVFKITPKAVTLADGVVANDKQYDGTDTATLSSQNLEGVKNGDQVTLDELEAYFAQSAAGNDIPVTITAALSGTAAGNYTFSAPTGLKANITPRELTLGGRFTVKDKDYDQSVTAEIDENEVVLQNIVDDDIVNTTNLIAEFTTANAGENIEVALVSATLIGDDKENYVIDWDSPLTSTGNILHRKLTLVDVQAKNKVYDGNDEAELVVEDLSGILDGDIVYVASAQGQFAQSDVGDDIEVAAAIELGGTSSSNYTIDQPSGLTANIELRELKITGTFEVADKTYEGNTDATLSSHALVLDNLVDNDQVDLDDIVIEFISPNAGESIEVNIVSADLTGDDADNYILSLDEAPSSEGNIQPLKLSLGGQFVADQKTYDRNNRAIIASHTIYLVGALTEFVTIDTLAAEFAQHHVGDSIRVNIVSGRLLGADASNYELDLTYRPFTRSRILPKKVSVDGIVAKNKIYDGTDVASIDLDSAELVGVIDPDDVSISNAVATFAHSNIGTDIPVTASLEITGVDAFNYVLEQPEGLTANILSPETILIAAEPRQKIYGDVDPDLTYLVTGTLIEGHRFDGELTREAGEAAGEYTISLGTLTILNEFDDDVSENYTIEFESSKLVIEKKAVEIVGSFEVETKVFDGSTMASMSTNNLSLSGILDGDDVELTGFVIQFDSPEVGVEKSVTIVAAALEGDDAGNYDLIIETAPSASGDIISGEASSLTSVIEVSPGTIVAGDSALVTISLLDEHGNPTETPLALLKLSATKGQIGPLVQFGVGQFSAHFKSTQAGIAEITGKLAGFDLQNKVNVTILPASPSPLLSTIEAAPDTIRVFRDGQTSDHPLAETASVQVKLYDEFGNPTQPATSDIEIWSESGNVSELRGNEDGSFSGIFSSSTIGSFVIQASVDGMTLHQSAFVHVVCDVLPGTLSLLSPEFDEENIGNSPTFSWTSAENALYYDFQLSLDPGFVAPTDVFVGSYQDTELQLDQLLMTGMSYYWRVRARTDCSTGDWVIGRFQTENGPDQEITTAPQLQAPADHTVQLPSTVLQWSTIPHAERYHLQVALDSEFSSIYFERSDLTMLYFGLSGLQWNTAYYWRVAAMNDDHVGPWSETRQFQIEDAPEFADALETQTVDVFKQTTDPDRRSLDVTVGYKGRLWLGIHDEDEAKLTIKSLLGTIWTDAGQGFEDISRFDLSTSPDGSLWVGARDETTKSATASNYVGTNWKSFPALDHISKAVSTNAPDGHFWTAVEDQSGSVLVYRMDSGFWKPVDASLELSNLASMKMAVGLLGNPVLAYETEQGRVGAKQLVGNEWVTLGDVSTSANLSALSIGPDGTIWLGIISKSDQRFQIFQFVNDSWKTILSDPTGVTEASLASSPDGSVWASFRDSNGLVYLQHYASGEWKTFGEPINGAGIDLAIGPDTRPWLVYQHTSGGVNLSRIMLKDQISTSLPEEVAIPDGFELHANYPNPFNPSTNIRFDLPRSSRVNLTVYNAIGQKIVVLVDEIRQAGTHTEVFDATGLPSGMYLYKIQSGTATKTQKMVLVK